MLRFRNDDVKISEIGDLIAEFLQLFVKIGIPQRRRAHIHATPIRAERRRVLAAHRHQLSHRTIRYRVYRASTAPRVRVKLGPPYQAARFVSPARLGRLGISSATRALVRVLEKTHG